jgi:predicted enzyme related to lactoylglutathione lyase
VPEAPRLVLTVLAVRDLIRMRTFYREAFGWPLAVDVPSYVEFVMPNGQRLGLYDHLGFARNTGLAAGFRGPGSTTSHAELYFHSEDLEEAGEKVLTAGGQLLSSRAVRDWGDEAAYFSDPEGNVIVFAQPSPPAAPG